MLNSKNFKSDISLKELSERSMSDDEVILLPKFNILKNASKLPK